MANPEHLSILHQSTDAWNTWRRDYPDVRPDLAYADLSGIDLSGIDLSEADLSEADLSDSLISRANLSRANLSRANLSWAVLSGAVLSGAILFETGFADIDLTNATGLETCVHHGPSILDHRTLVQSGELPLAFLRGCGLPDTIIDIIPALRGSVFTHYSCFISYSSRDGAFVDRLYADLQNRGVRCWRDSEDLKIGERFRDAIFGAIRTHDKLLLVLSENSVRSPWVADEVEKALAEERRQKRDILFPIRIDGAAMKTRAAWAETIRNSRQIGNFEQWTDPPAYGKAFDRLLRDLNQVSPTSGRRTRGARTPRTTG